MAVHSFGGKVAADWSGGSSYTDFAEVVSFSSPTLNVTKSPSHHLQSPNALKTKEPGMAEIDDAEVMLRYTKAQYAQFLNNIRVKGSIRFTFAEGSILSFTGFLTRIGAPEHGDDDTVNQTVGLVPSGAMTFVQA